VLTAYDHALTVLLAILFPISAATFGFRRLARATPERLPQARISSYRRAILLQWTLSAVVVALWVGQGRAWFELGVVPRLGGGLVACAVGLAVVVVVMRRQRARVLRDGEALRAVRQRLENVRIMMPHSARELRWFFGLSITAGACEEFLYRGYLIWYFQHFLGLIPAAAVAAVVFGIGHSYQGPRGMALTALVGAFLGAIYLLSRSLAVPMLIHVLMDVHSGHLAYAAYVHEAQEARDAAGLAAAMGGTDAGATPTVEGTPAATLAREVAAPAPEADDAAGA
jgi:hypothetical protein